MANKHLAIYLNDHLAGATGALELVLNMRQKYLRGSWVALSPLKNK